MKVISVASLKGGSGKTSVSIFLAQLFALKGRVLAVDLDHNNNLTDYFLRRTDTGKIEGANIYQALAGTRKLGDCIHAAEEHANIAVLPATPQLARIGLELARDPGAILRFAKSLRKLDFVAIVIDTPPALSFELSCALYSSSIVLSPVSFSRWTVQGFALLRDETQAVAGATGRSPVLRALPAQVNDAQEEKLRGAEFADFTESAIHRSAAIKAACDSGRPLKAGSASHRQFAALAEELL